MTTLSPENGGTWIIAHRGARDETPENTAAAFERALTYPVDGIELDVQLSADGIPVVYHDYTLARVARSRRRVSDLTLSELERLDWGGWFAPQFAGEPLTTLERTLRRFGGRTRLMIEIKSGPRDRAAGRSDHLTDAVVRLLDETGGATPLRGVYVLSFDPDVLTRAFRLAPQWRYVLNLSEGAPEAVMSLRRRDTDHLWAVDSRIAALSERLVRWSHDRGLRMFTYTCNGPRQLAKALALGVDAVLGDRPGWLCTQMKRT